MVLNLPIVTRWLGQPVPEGFIRYDSNETNPFFPHKLNYILDLKVTPIFFSEELSNIYLFEKEGSVIAAYFLFTKTDLYSQLKGQIGEPFMEAGVGVGPENTDPHYFHWSYKGCSIDLSLAYSIFEYATVPKQQLILYNVPYKDLLIFPSENR